jgi:hypothetical protein
VLWQPADLCYGTMSLSIHFWCICISSFLPVAFDWVRWPTYLFSFSRFTFYFHVFMCRAKKKSFYAPCWCFMLIYAHGLSEENFNFNLFRMDFFLRSWNDHRWMLKFLNAFFFRNDKLPVENVFFGRFLSNWP